MGLVSSFGSSSGMVRGTGGLELAKTEEAAAGMGSPCPCGSLLAPKPDPAREGKGRPGKGGGVWSNFAETGTDWGLASWGLVLSPSLQAGLVQKNR